MGDYQENIANLLANSEGDIGFFAELVNKIREQEELIKSLIALVEATEKYNDSGIGSIENIGYSFSGYPRATS